MNKPIVIADEMKEMTTEEWQTILKLADSKTQEALKAQCAGPADLLRAPVESLPGDD